MEILLVRHGQSEANGAGVWQGRLDSPLTELGRSQAAGLGRRMSGLPVDLVVASPLVRAARTAAALGRPVEVVPAWQEMDLGAWEGEAFEDVRRDHGHVLAALRAGEDLRFGVTGERLSEFRDRAWGALDDLASRLGDGGRAVAVTHGGVIDVLVAAVIGGPVGRRAYPIVANTSITVLARRAGQWVLDRFNDAAHLGVESPWVAERRREGVPVVGFVRHGVTVANKEGRVQGQSCRGLDDDGREQARLFAAWYGAVDRVVSSPLDRARQTAAALTAGRELEVSGEVIEIACGTWEGLTYAEVVAGDPALAERVFRLGEDLPRGHTGETFAQVEARMSRFVEGSSFDPAERAVVVTHGGAIRSLVGWITGAGPAIRGVLGTPANTSVTHVALTPSGPVLADYALSPHLEEPGPWMDGA